MKKGFFVLVCLVSAHLSSGQSAFAPLNSDYYHLIDRLEICSDSQSVYFHSSAKPYGRKSIGEFLDLQMDNEMSTQDQANIDYLKQDNWDWVYEHDESSKKPFLKKLYRSRSDFYHYKSDDFTIHLNPVIHWSYGRDGDLTTNINTRGAEIRGDIDGKVGFYSFLGENQAVFPEYVRQVTYGGGAIPNENFWKEFKETGFDWFTARGYVTLQPTKHIGVQFGHDKNFIGNGYRSLILSDYAGNYPFLKINTRVWKLNYTNIFAQMNADIFSDGSNVPVGNNVFPVKYFTFHHLSLNLTKNLNVGMFESIMFSRGDSTGSSGFDVNYLNPIIFYRSIEQNVGSQGNAIIGMDMKWNLWRTLQLYGQLTLDEFRLNRFTSGNGWWGNKYAVQAGMKYVNAFGVSNLDLQGEVNVVRPYTYSHRDKETAYQHYNQSLAHPLGANFVEAIGIARYQPHEKVFVTGKLMLIQVGKDTASSNWGNNIFLDNVTRESDYGNDLLQGVKSNIMFADLTVSYRWKHNVFFDLKQVIRKEESEFDAYDSNTFFTSLSFRMNISQRLHEF